MLHESSRMKHHEYSVYIGGIKSKQKEKYCKLCKTYIYSVKQHILQIQNQKLRETNVRSHKKQTGKPR